MAASSAPTASVAPTALATVARMADASLAAPTSRELDDALARALLEALPCTQVHVQHIFDDGAVSEGFVRFADGREDERFVLDLDVGSGVSHVVGTLEPLVADRASESPHLRQDLVRRWGVGSAVFLPLVWHGSADAVAIAVALEPGRFGPESVEVGTMLARIAAGGCARLELEQRVTSEADRHAALARAARSLNESLDLTTVIEALCREADLAIGGDSAGVYFPDGEGGAIAVAGHDTPDNWRGLRLAPGQGAGGRVLQTGEPTVISSDREEADAPDNPQLNRTRTACAVPVRWGGALRGALSIGWDEPHKVTDTDVEVLEAIAELAAVACQNAEAYERAQRAARTDSLTGVLNHGAMQERIGEEISRARRHHAPLSCLLLDLDDFKALNDRAGHGCGDQVLRAVARCLSQDFRPYDHIARYGGDEFVVMLPGVEEDAARGLAERVREAVGRAAEEVFSDMPMRSSIGVAQWEEPGTAADLLERADRALLLAKRTGKGRVVVASAWREQDDGTEDGDADSELMLDFWDFIAAADPPRAALAGLPAFLHRRLALEEVALLEVDAVRWRTLSRVAADRSPGDPAPMAFAARSVSVEEEAWVRLETGPIWRSSLEALWRAVGITDGMEAVAPAGSYAAIGLVRAGRPLGLLVLRSAQRDFPLAVLRRARALAAQAVTVMLASTGEGSTAAVSALAAAIDARDNYTHRHSEEVVELACDVAETLGLAAGEVERIRHGALLHDVGKVAIPNEILLKPGPLDEAEWAEMREHPAIGERILRRVPELVDIAPLVRHEHESWDGSGYPDGLRGDAIPIGSRVILACDAYNAMVSRRPYREPLPGADAVAELRRCAGTQFDPDVVDALVAVLAPR